MKGSKARRTGMEQHGLKSTLRVPELIVFGSHTIDELGEYVLPYGKRATLIRGGASLEESGGLDKIRSILKRSGVSVQELAGVRHDPDESQVMEFVETATSFNPDLVLGIGGGSVIDTAKAVSIIMTNGGTVSDYWEGKAFTKPSIPYIAVPTTSGTGAEITKNAVITSKNHTFKKSIRSEFMIPNIAMVDPKLTVSMPPAVTAYTGLDALVQNLEAYTSKNAGPITDTLAYRGIELAGNFLLRAYEHGDDTVAREGLALASLYGGITLANAGLGLSHGLSHPLGVLCGLAHGHACAITMPAVMEMNYPSRKEKYDTVASLLGFPDNGPVAGADAFRALLDSMGISTALSSYGVKSEHIASLVKGSKGGSRGYNPIDHSDEAVEAMLRSML
jgi:alcohol dehydrogenase class IV